MLLINSIRRLHQQCALTQYLSLFLCIIAINGCGGSSDDRNTTSSRSSSSALSSSSISSAITSNTSSSSQTGTGSSSSGAIRPNILFDDFDYTNSTQMITNGWYVRSGSGGPGAVGVNWSRDYVTFISDPDNSNNRLMRMRASTRGSGATTTQSQVTHNGHYLRGTYAARMYFTNEPVSGDDGDHIVETFYTITPLHFSMDPDYSEIDFEYLANGGWGQTRPTMFLTTWETYQPDPWIADNIHTALVADHSGWRTLVAQVDESEVRYYIDGILRATHGGKYYPESDMSINFNIWFIDGGLINSSSERVYQQDVDWVYFVDQEILSTQEVEAQVEQLRRDSVLFRDTVN